MLAVHCREEPRLDVLAHGVTHRRDQNSPPPPNRTTRRMTMRIVVLDMGDLVSGRRRPL